MTAVGLPVWWYGAVLAALWLLALVGEGRFLTRVTTALLCNWGAHMAHHALFGDPTPYLFSIFADTLTAVVILTRPAGRMQATIGWTLLVQIVIHFAYAMHLRLGGYVAQAEYRYWMWIDWIAFAQMILVGGSLGDGMAKRILGDGYGWRGRQHRNVAGRHDPSGVAHP